MKTRIIAVIVIISLAIVAFAMQLEPTETTGLSEYHFALTSRPDPVTNILLIGTDGDRSDVLVLATVDTERKTACFFSIPRDTFYPQPWYDGPEYNKINALYKKKGVEVLTDAVNEVVAPLVVDNYVVMDYAAVSKIVDAVGGVKVNIPFDMVYDDEVVRPPLHIDFKAGEQTLSGSQAIKYLRFRKNNDGTGYVEGDIGRIRAQQEFMRRFIGKINMSNILEVLENIFEYLETDVSLAKTLALAGEIGDISNYRIEFKMLPGEANLRELWYYDVDEEAFLDLLDELNINFE